VAADPPPSSSITVRASGSPARAAPKREATSKVCSAPSGIRPPMPGAMADRSTKCSTPRPTPRRAPPGSRRSRPGARMPPGSAQLRGDLEFLEPVHVFGLRRGEPAAGGRSGEVFRERSCSAHPYGGLSRIASPDSAAAPAWRPSSDASSHRPLAAAVHDGANLRACGLIKRSRHGSFNGFRLAGRRASGAPRAGKRET
jgi:hypothetical protein